MGFGVSCLAGCVVAGRHLALRSRHAAIVTVKRVAVETVPEVDPWYQYTSAQEQARARRGACRRRADDLKLGKLALSAGGADDATLQAQRLGHAGFARSVSTHSVQSMTLSELSDL